MKEKTVGEVVRGRPVYVVQRNDSVVDAVRYMTQYRVGAVPVLLEGDIVGSLMALGLVYGRERLDDWSGYIRSLPPTRRFCRRF